MDKVFIELSVFIAYIKKMFEKFQRDSKKKKVGTQELRYCVIEETTPYSSIFFSSEGIIEALLFFLLTRLWWLGLT